MEHRIALILSRQSVEMNYLIIALLHFELQCQEAKACNDEILSCTYFSFVPLLLRCLHIPLNNSHMYRILILQRFCSRSDESSSRKAHVLRDVRGRQSWRHGKQPHSIASIGRAREPEPIIATVCPQWSRKLFPAILLLFSKILRFDFREDAVRTCERLRHCIPE